MEISNIYIIIALVVMAVIVLLAIYTCEMRKQNKPSKIAIFAILLVISGIVFGDDRWIGYSLIGAGIILAIIDIIITSRNNRTSV